MHKIIAYLIPSHPLLSRLKQSSQKKKNKHYAEILDVEFDAITDEFLG